VKAEHISRSEGAIPFPLSIRASVLVVLLLLLPVSSPAMTDLNIVYIEASTVNRWKLDKLEERTGNNNYRFDIKRKYDFDKSELVNDAATSVNPKPDMIILQECAVYFPGDLQAYKDMYEDWIEKIRDNDITPVLATTVPPAESQGALNDLKALIKTKLLGRPGQLEQITEFNDWLRDLAQRNRLMLLDLEKALRISDSNRHMNNKFNSGDGIHLNRAAYDELDRLVLDTLDGNDRNIAPNLAND